MIDLHTWHTSAGRKVSIALEELEVPYRVFPVDITHGEQKAPEFVAISPNGKIPYSPALGSRCPREFGSGVSPERGSTRSNRH